MSFIIVFRLSSRAQYDAETAAKEYVNSGVTEIPTENDYTSLPMNEVSG